MRAAIFRNGEIVVDEMGEPTPGPGQALVKTLACGICGSDLHARKHAHRMVEMAKYTGRKPMDLSRDVVFGHEFCCEVLDYGPGTQRRLKPGTRARERLPEAPQQELEDEREAPARVEAAARRQLGFPSTAGDCWSTACRSTSAACVGIRCHAAALIRPIWTTPEPSPRTPS